MKNFRILLFLLLVVSVSCKNKGSEKKTREKAPVGVEVVIAESQDIMSNIEVNGTVLSNEMVELHPEISGRITYLNVTDGADVKAGTVLVRVNDADLQAELTQQRNQLDLAMKTEQRYKALLATNSINQSDYDVALSQVNNYRALVDVTLAQIDKTVIRAPFSGRLGLRQVSPGAYVTPQTVISTLQQTEKVKIDFTMPESYNGLVEIGDTVAIRSNITQDTRKAVVIAFEPEISTATRNIKARAVLAGKGISPGAFVRVMLQQKHKGIMVPSNCLIPEALSNQVVVVHNNKALFRNIETGVRNADGVEVTSGIEAGDSIVVSGVLFVRPDAPVKVKKVRKHI